MVRHLYLKVRIIWVVLYGKNSAFNKRADNTSCGRLERNLEPGTEFEVHSTPLGIFFVEIPKDPVKALSGLMKGSGIKEGALKKMRQKDERLFRKKFGI